MNHRRFTMVAGLAAALGFIFAAFSTYDFAQHLDRQTHAIHCSFVPGLGATDASGSSGCQTTMMSPYSSVLRTSLWGGIPIALPAMGVFAFLAFWALELVVSRRSQQQAAMGAFTLGMGLPALTSVVMAYISLVTLGAACKMCIGIYAASAVGLVAAFLAWRSAGNEDDDEDDSRDTGSHEPAPSFVSYVVFAALVGTLFVAVPTLAYVARAPNHDALITACGSLNEPRDVYGVMVPLDNKTDAVPAIEVLDPLCPSCRAFEERFAASSVVDKIHRQAVMFPLDNSCNWMVDSAVHPGACAISEAVLCAKDEAPEVITWSFANQEAIREATSQDPSAAAKMASAAFPKLKSCIGSTAAKAKLNKSLRWAVRNQMRILTPQLYIDGARLCDEDVDLGLDYALAHMLTSKAGGTP